jgi:hypothetical protein
MIATRQRIDQKLDRLKLQMERTRSARWAAGAVAFAGAMGFSWWRRHRRRRHAQPAAVVEVPVITGVRRRL